MSLYTVIQLSFNSSPGNDSFFASQLVCQLLNFDEPLSLKLEQCLVARQTDIVHSFWVVHTQSGALSSGQQEHSNTTLRYLMQA